VRPAASPRFVALLLVFVVLEEALVGRLERRFVELVT